MAVEPNLRRVHLSADASGPNGLFYRWTAPQGVPSSVPGGPAFSPDGKILFVNIQAPGVTLAISGPWQRCLG